MSRKDVPIVNRHSLVSGNCPSSIYTKYDLYFGFQVPQFGRSGVPQEVRLALERDMVHVLRLNHEKYLGSDYGWELVTRGSCTNSIYNRHGRGVSIYDEETH